MPVPKKHSSHRTRGLRRSHDGLKVHANVEVCPNCAEIKLRHQACAKCGQYQGRQVLPAKAEKE